MQWRVIGVIKCVVVQDWVLVVVVEDDQGLFQCAVDEVSAAAEAIMDFAAEGVARDVHDTRDIPHGDAGVIDSSKWGVE